jgi:hypothetical protein
MIEKQNNIPLKEESIDIKKYFWLILRNWFWFGSAIMVGLGAAYLVNRYSDPIYRVNMSIIIEDDEGGNYYGNNNLIEGFNLFSQSKKIDNEIAVLRSYDLTKRAVEELDFRISYFGVGRLRERPKYSLNEFLVEIDTSHNQTLYTEVFVTPEGNEKYRLEIESLNVDTYVAYGEYYESENFRFRIILRDSSAVLSPSHEKYFFYLNSVEGLTNAYRGKLSVERMTEEGSVLVLSTAGSVPQREIDFLNKIAEVYIRSGLE